jgi:hypothetical protein
MDFYLITFATDTFKNRQLTLKKFAESLPFKGTICYDDKWLLNEEFSKSHTNILSQSRGFGYWLWKPYIIIDALKRVNDTDIVFYLDSGDVFNADILDYAKPILQDNICLLCGGNIENINKYYTKRDCFYYMGCDTIEYTDVIQIEAGIQLWKKTELSVKLLKEILKYAEDYRILTDSPNECGLDNYSGFIDHRHDQSILTNIQIKYNLLADANLKSFVKQNI